MVTTRTGLLVPSKLLSVWELGLVVVTDRLGTSAYGQLHLNSSIPLQVTGEPLYGERSLLDSENGDPILIPPHPQPHCG